MKKHLSPSMSILKALRLKWYYLFILIAVLLWTGCSLVGLLIGSALSPSVKEKTVIGWQTNTIKYGQHVTLFLGDDRQIEGKYNGMFYSPNAINPPSNTDQQTKLSPAAIHIPQNGDTLIFSWQLSNSGRMIQGKKYAFRGLSADNILIDLGSSQSIIPLSTLVNLTDMQGSTIDVHNLHSMLKAGQIPSKSIILINSLIGNQLIAPASVVQVTTKTNGYGGTGFLIGGLVDLAVVIFAISNSISRPPVSSGKFSCPYIYSYDGHQYKLDGETFGGAIFRSAQRTDLDNLDFLKESHGEYKLKLTNELEETQYIDEFKLKVVDHSIGSKVMPGFDGVIHSLNSLQPPITAMNQSDQNILDLVKAKDDKIWISNPFTRNPENKAEGRDAIILEFDKPADATFVKLALNVQNTDWASYLQGQMLSLHGNKLDDWYALMNSSKVAASAFKQIMIREGMLLIQLWDGHSWVTRDYVWEVGPSVAKDQVVKLNLTNYAEQNLRIRLESTVGFWMINSVEADYSNDVPITITELSAIKASDQDGHDLLGLLKTTDEQYYAQPTNHDWAEIIFESIPNVKNTTRTFILKCNGYYTIHTNHTGEPQKELLNKLITEPGAYGQYTLQLLNQNLVDSFKDHMSKYQMQ